MAVRSVLCPTDFSECARRALAQALAVARAHHAELTVLHVHAPPLALVDRAAPPSPHPTLGAPEREALLTQLAEALTPVRATGTTARACLLEGEPSDEILRYARITKADLVVMGTHGRRGLDGCFGSVAERVVQKAPCAVMTVPAGDSDPSLPPSRILCPLELIDSEPTLGVALSMARAFGCELLLLHVLIDASPHSALAEGVDWEVLEARLVAAARHRLARAVGEQEPSAVPYDCVVTSGKPYREILKVVAERPSQLVVMGIHGSNPLQRMFFGSTALQVLRLARCPVVTVRPPEVPS